MNKEMNQANVSIEGKMTMKKMRMFLAAIMILSAHYVGSAQTTVSGQNLTVHYPAVSQRGGINEIVLVKAPGIFQDGDEVAVRTSKNVLAGTGVVANGTAVVTVWSDDAYTSDVVEGAVEGEPMSVSRWSKSEGKEQALSLTGITDGLTGTALNTTLVYISNGVLVVTAGIQTAVEDVQTMPTDFALEQNYPNPFNPSTMIKYALPSDGMVTLQIFNSLGAQVATLVSGTQHAGVHEVSFNASGLASGMYVYILRTASFSASKRMMLLK